MAQLTASSAPGVLTQNHLGKTVVCVGNFDGVHLGHQKIIAEAQKVQEQLSSPLVVYTFRPHPLVILKPHVNITLIHPYDQKLRLLQTLGADFVIEQPFTERFAHTSPSEFVRQVLKERLNAHHLVVGYDFRFGQGRQGELSVLSQLCQADGIDLTVVEAETIVPGSPYAGEVISSSKIRRTLSQGHLDFARALLGRPFFYTGKIVPGDQRGRSLEFPTANIYPHPEIVALPRGVYATRAHLIPPSGKTMTVYPSVTNVGVAPTFHESAGMRAVVETHFLDTITQADFYDWDLQVDFLEYLRPEQKFASPSALVEQIRADCDRARSVAQIPA